MTGYNCLTEVDYLIIIVLKDHKNGLMSHDIMTRVNAISPVQYGPYQFRGKLVKLYYKGYIYSKYLKNECKTWYLRKDIGELDMLDGDYNRKQLKELVYEFIKE